MKLYCPECETRYEGDEYQNCPADGARLFRLDSDQDKGDPLIGTVIDDRFRIDDLIGAGGMGAVYRAVQLSVNRDVALKVLRAELADEEVALERFYREAKVVSDLSHPNIVRLVDFGRDDAHDLLYLVMEMVKGMDLGDLLYRGRLKPNLALEVVYQTCGALTEPHARGIVHRDLKPENLIIVPISDGTFQVKVLDFGIARALEGGATQLTKTGMICGTPSYMSPEQAQNEAMDGRTDLYALGVILFEMLTGEPPFSGDTSLQVLLNHIRKPAPPLEQLIPSELVAGPICELVGELLAKDPHHRPESARAVRDRIDSIRHQLQLEPVRLKRDADGEDAFKEWIHKPLGFVDADGNFSVDSQEELPASQTTGEAAGVEIHQTEKELEPADTTGESAQRVPVADENGASTEAPAAKKAMTAEVDAAQSEELSVASGAYATTTTEVVNEASSGGKRMLLIGGGLGLIAILCVASGVVGYLIYDDYFEQEEAIAQAADDDESSEEQATDEQAGEDEVDDDEVVEADREAEGAGGDDRERDEDDGDEVAEVAVEMEVESTDTVQPVDDDEAGDDASQDSGGDVQRDRGQGEPQRDDEPDDEPEEVPPPVEPDDGDEDADEEGAPEEETAPEEQEAASETEVQEMRTSEEAHEIPEPEEHPQEEIDDVEEEEEEQDDVRDRLRRLRTD